jgi:hypothetical protein
VNRLQRRGERGPQGDHGQDGQPGPAGPPGEGIKHLDRRLLLLYLALVALLVSFFVYIQWDQANTNEARSQFEKAVVSNCETGQKNTEAFNALLNRLVEAVKANPTYSAAERAKAIAFYESGKQTVPECPPLAKGK